LASFLNLYGFTRNVSMASLVVALVLAGATLFNDEVDVSELWAGAGLALLVSVVMYFRYLKFYRQYSVELYVTYAEI
jgi:predicted neutral ceramidase superfamily lipid hydrolase